MCLSGLLAARLGRRDDAAKPLPARRNNTPRFLRTSGGLFLLISVIHPRSLAQSSRINMGKQNILMGRRSVMALKQRGDLNGYAADCRLKR